MLLAIDRLQALQLIGSPRLIREDKVVPRESQHCPDSPYKPGYDWLFQYERQIAAFLEKWLRPYRYELIGEKGILCEALSNAFAHGHKKDTKLPIFVRVFLGKKGLIVQVENGKRGFDVEEVYSRYRRRRHYYLKAGNGIRLMAESHNFGIFHDFKGKTFHLLHLFDGQLEQLPPDMIFTPQRKDKKSTYHRLSNQRIS